MQTRAWTSPLYLLNFVHEDGEWYTKLYLMLSVMSFHSPADGLDCETIWTPILPVVGHKRYNSFK